MVSHYIVSIHSIHSIQSIQSESENTQKIMTYNILQYSDSEDSALSSPLPGYCWCWCRRTPSQALGAGDWPMRAMTRPLGRLSGAQWRMGTSEHDMSWHVSSHWILKFEKTKQVWKSRKKSGKVRSHDPGFSHIPACAPKRASTWCVSACPKCKRKSYEASSMYDKGPSWSLSISTKHELLPWALHVQWSSPLLLYYWTLINSAEICRRTWCLQAILLKIGVFFHFFYVSFFSHNMHLACICAFLVVAPHSQHICALNSAWKYENTKWQSWYTDLRGEILHRNIGTSQHLERSELQPRLTNIHITCRCPKALEALRLTGQCNTWKALKAPKTTTPWESYHWPLSQMEQLPLHPGHSCNSPIDAANSNNSNSGALAMISDKCSRSLRRAIWQHLPSTHLKYLKI